MMLKHGIFCGFHKGTNKLFIFHRQLNQFGREAGKGVFCLPPNLIKLMQFLN
jgi:hypothetical protein